MTETQKQVLEKQLWGIANLLRVAKETKVSEFYGQELNRTTYNLARMNMILHDVHFREFDIQQEDTLENPQHIDKRFEVVVANSPFSAIFYGTSIPTCILVLKKCRKADDNIVFIDASGDGHFIKNGNQNELRDEDVELIVDTYRSREEKEKYSYIATLGAIAENDYNLNIPRYVDTFEEEEPIDLDAVSTELKQLDKDLQTTNKEIAGFCKELNISTPF